MMTMAETLPTVYVVLDSDCELGSWPKLALSGLNILGWIE